MNWRARAFWRGFARVGGMGVATLPKPSPPCANGIPPCDGDCGWNPDDPTDPCNPDRTPKEKP